MKKQVHFTVTVPVIAVLTIEHNADEKTFTIDYDAESDIKLNPRDVLAEVLRCDEDFQDACCEAFGITEPAP